MVFCTGAVSELKAAFADWRRASHHYALSSYLFFLMVYIWPPFCLYALRRRTFLLAVVFFFYIFVVTRCVSDTVLFCLFFSSPLSTAHHIPRPTYRLVCSIRYTSQPHLVYLLHLLTRLVFLNQKRT